MALLSNKSPDSTQFPSKYQHNPLHTLKEQYSTSYRKAKQKRKLRIANTVLYNKRTLEASPSLISSYTWDEDKVRGEMRERIVSHNWNEVQHLWSELGT